MGRGGGFSSHRSAPRSSRSMSSGGRSTSHSSLRSGPSPAGGGRPPGSFWGAPPPHGYGYRRRRPYGYGHYGNGCGCGFCAIVIILMIVLGGVVKLFTPDDRNTLPNENQAAIVADESEEKPELGQHTSMQEVQRDKELQQPQKEKLETEVCTYVEEMLDDRLGWLSDRETVEQAMEYFYEKTGVQPYLLICDSMEGKGGDIADSEGEQYLQQLYDSLYTDEGHMIFVFMEYEESRYITYLYTGQEADYVIDERARNLFLNNADAYYTDLSLSDEEYFAKVFRVSADSIMD